MMFRVVNLLAATAIIASSVACSGSLGESDIPPGCGDGTKSATEACDQADLGGATCATAAAPGWTGVLSCTAQCRINIAGCSAPPTTWNAMTSDRWSLYNVGASVAGAKGFISSVFDGRYLYFSPYGDNAGNVPHSGVVARLDTQGKWGSPDAWTRFDIAATVNPAANGFVGGAFDGRYVYFIPHYNGAYHGTVARYDTQASFTEATSWKTFDVSSVNSNAVGFAIAAFDGRYLYLAPHHNNVDFSSTVVRYDTQAEFDKPESWSKFDVSSVNPGAKGFVGAAFDGRYVYLIPLNNSAYDGIIARYDTKNPGGFADPKSWIAVDIASLLPEKPTGFWGSVFDGRYLYLVPNTRNQPTPQAPGAVATHGMVTRFDTLAEFTSANSWSTFDLTTNVNAGAQGFVGGTFDGRYVYLVPFQHAGPGIATSYHGVITRYDTSSPFTAPTSWSTLNLPAALNEPQAVGYNGAGFDGRYIYLSPRLLTDTTTGGVVARFDAKSPSWLPIGWNRAFD